jgi:hypothetical protein
MNSRRCIVIKQCLGRDQERIGPPLYQACECRFDLTIGAGREHVNLPAGGRPSRLHLFNKRDRGRAGWVD